MTAAGCYHVNNPPGSINTMHEKKRPQCDRVISHLDDFTFPDHKQTLTSPLPDTAEDGIECATHAMNYYLIVAFHSDVDMRPCNPVLRVIHLAKHADTLQNELLHNPHGTPMLTTCQLCDSCVNTKQEFWIDTYKLLCISAISVTDGEAYTLINNVADINMHIARNQTVLSQRSNIGLLPRFFHRSVQIGVRSLMQVRSAPSATDVQLCMILLRESLSSARSVCVQLRALHPYLSTPENLYDALTLFSRPLDVPSFKSGAFKFALLPT